MSWKPCLWNAIGVAFGLLLGLIYAKFMRDLHENVLFFSGIREVERLISMRTESGFYYSFYQQVVNRKSLAKGLSSLLNDTKSEYPYSINALQKFNIYPEVFLAILYKLLPIRSFLTPIFFYSNACFFFSGLAVTSAYFLSWVYSGDWIFGVITGTWLLVNYEDSGRTNFVLNLRENFALPFLWLQFIFVIKSLRNCRFHQLFAITLFTFLFSTCWQFSQFVLLLQTCALSVVCLLKPEEHAPNVRKIVVSQSLGFSLTIILHFFQPMLLSAPVVWLNFSLLICSHLHRKFSIKSFVFCAFLTSVVFLCLLFSVKFALNIQADSHIWTFFLAKFGIILSDDGVPFETSIYLCHIGFNFMEYDFVERLQKNGILQLYVLAVVLFVLTSLHRLFKKCEFRTDQLFVTVKSLLFAFMAYTTMRMKYVFLPQMAIVAASMFGVLDRFIGRYFKFVVIGAIVAKLSNDHYGFYLKVLSREQEFYDPDTVALMEFIKNQSKANVYAGSMQLMAGVKACTSRRIANHPHFEDKRLRDRTLRIYSMYARIPIEQVYETLKAEKITHIIVENSICYTRSTGCALKDVIDTAYKYQTESGLQPFQPRKVYPRSEIDRFCSSVERTGQSLFTRIFQNRTFRIYRLA